MAMAESNTPQETKTDHFGGLLQREYGDDCPNTSIDHFIIMLGKPISKSLEATPGHPTPEPPAISEEEFSAMLKRIQELKFLSFIEKGWKSKRILAFEYDSASMEREQEEQINRSIREDLKTNFKRILHGSSLPPLPDIGIIFTRACLYKQKPNEIPTTNQIGKILKSKYKCPAEDTPVDYFYLIIQEESGYELDDEALEVLKELKEGEWEPLCKDNWPGLFIGYYPKKPFMTERQREWDINIKVRKSLIEKLKQKIEAKQGENFEAKVHVIITRACVYTALEQEKTSV